MSGNSDNSSEATLLSRPATPSTPVNLEQQKELLDNKENLSPTKDDASPKRGDTEVEHPEPLAPASPSKVNAQAGALIRQQEKKERDPVTQPLIEATPKYAPPPGKPPPIPPRKPMEPDTDSIIEDYARQQDVTEVIAHCLFQFSCAIRGKGVDPSGEQLDEIHQTFFGQTLSHTVPEKEKPKSTPFNSVITRMVNKPKDIYEALDNEFDLSEREGGSRTYASISKPPPIFSILLDRVGWDNVAKRPLKHEDHVEVPETIFLDRYLESEPASDLMQRRAQSWEMKKELSALLKRKDQLEQNVSNGRSLPVLLSDAKMALEYLRTNPDFTAPEGDHDGELDELLDPTISEKLGAMSAELTAELDAVTDRAAYLQQQLKEAFADMRRYPYRLHAAFFHRGGAGSGHYWVYIYDHKKECWRRYNDDRVNVVQDRNEIFAKASGPFAVPTPYFLVYVREDEAPKLVETVKRDIVYPMPSGPPPGNYEEWEYPNAAQTQWHDGPATSQIEAMPPGDASNEMREINGGMGAWTGASNGDDRMPANFAPLL